MLTDYLKDRNFKILDQDVGFEIIMLARTWDTIMSETKPLVKDELGVECWEQIKTFVEHEMRVKIAGLLWNELQCKKQIEIDFETEMKNRRGCRGGLYVEK